MISIITPVYNGVRFIEDCIKSVIDQSCIDVEHIIVDGFSTDGTVKIIRKYAGSFPHIRWISERDRGQSDAMNKGVAMARGEIIGLLNVDDFYEPNVLIQLSKIFQTLPEPSLLVGNCNVLDDDKELLFVNKPKNLKFTDLLMGPYVNPHPINPSAYFYHQSLHEKVGYYDVEKHYALDLDFILKAVQVATVKYVNETWGNFCMVKGSKTYIDSGREEGVRRLENLFRAYRESLPYFQKLLTTLIFLLSKNLFSLSPNRVASTIKYFSIHPQELPWRFKARVKKIVNSIR